MALRTRFTIALVIVFAVGLIVSWSVASQILMQNARKETLEIAGLMMESAASIRKYTSEQIRPLILTDNEKQFHPQSVPSYSANQLFASLRQTRGEYTYREATLNPSNPADKASDWEADIVQYFRNAPQAAEFTGERNAGTGPTLFVARPLKVNDEACLSCHGDPKLVPKAVAAVYGTENGTNWKMGETVGAQIALVPTSVPEKRARQELLSFLILMFAVFAGLLLCVNLMLARWVVGPVDKIARAAEAISTGDTDQPELAAEGKDEIGRLGASFNRMTRSLKQAMRMIDGE
ncbi:MAG: DUF3365 domain-containing protein [Fimbriimonadaceae bacterium]